MCCISIVLRTIKPVVAPIARRAGGYNLSIFAHASGAEAVAGDLLGDIALRGSEAHTHTHRGRHLVHWYEGSTDEVCRCRPRAVNHAPP